MNRMISMILVFVMLTSMFANAAAEGFGALLGGYAKQFSDVLDQAAEEIDSAFSTNDKENQESNDSTADTSSDKNTSSFWNDIGTIAGGLLAEDVGIPKEIHYGDYDQFKKDIDLIEAFFQDYVDFMKNYDANDLTMIAKYTSMLASYTEAMRVLDALDEAKMSKKEASYYNTVLLRINKLLYQSL